MANTTAVAPPPRTYDDREAFSSEHWEIEGCDREDSTVGVGDDEGGCDAREQNMAGPGERWGRQDRNHPSFLRSQFYHLAT